MHAVSFFASYRVEHLMLLTFQKKCSILVTVINIIGNTISIYFSLTLTFAKCHKVASKQQMFSAFLIHVGNM